MPDADLITIQDLLELMGGMDKLVCPCPFGIGINEQMMKIENHLSLIPRFAPHCTSLHSTISILQESIQDLF